MKTDALLTSIRSGLKSAGVTMTELQVGTRLSKPVCIDALKANPWRPSVETLRKIETYLAKRNGKAKP